MDQEKIGKFIAKLRKEKKLTQEELAEQLKVSNKSVSRWENGKCMPDISLLLEISELLGISVNELIIGEKIADQNIKTKSEEVTKTTLNYADKKIKKEQKKYKWIIIIVIIIIGFILATIDYNKIKHGQDPMFMIRITPGGNSVQHYIGLGYRLEQKVGLSYKEELKNSTYIKFGPWLFTWNVDILPTTPDFLAIEASNQKITANRGSFCWNENNVATCADSIGLMDMEYDEELSISTSSEINITNSYGYISNIEVYNEPSTKDDNILENDYLTNIKLEFTDNSIKAPSKPGTYFIRININSSHGNVWHSFKIKVNQ